MPAKYWIPKHLGPAPGSPGLVPGLCRDSAGFQPGFTPFSDPRLTAHTVLCFFLTTDGFIHIQVVPGPKLGDIYTTSPHRLILAVTALPDMTRKRLLASFVQQKTGDLYRPASKVLAYLKRHGASFEKVGEVTYSRYSCTCSKGFTRIYKVDGIVRCAKCYQTSGLSEVECIA